MKNDVLVFNVCRLFVVEKSFHSVSLHKHNIIFTKTHNITFYSTHPPQFYFNCFFFVKSFFTKPGSTWSKREIIKHNDILQHVLAVNEHFYKQHDHKYSDELIFSAFHFFCFFSI